MVVACCICLDTAADLIELGEDVCACLAEDVVSEGDWADRRDAARCEAYEADSDR